MKQVLIIAALAMCSGVAEGSQCSNSGHIEVQDSQTRKIKVTNCKVLTSQQGGQGDCAFIAHKVECDEWQGYTVVSQRLDEQAGICHVFSKDDGFPDGKAEACLDRAFESQMTAWTGGPKTRNIAAESSSKPEAGGAN